MHVSGDATPNFTKKWRTAKYDKEQAERPRDEVEMNKFVEASFMNWKWISSEEHQEGMRKVRHQMKLSKMFLQQKRDFSRKLTNNN
jgi:hypothetical protein